jgi:Mg-chelatase subunit ChlI
MRSAVLTATTTGIVSIFDLRMRLCVGSYKGKIGGSIRNFHVHPTKPIFACSSIDRFVRVFDINKRSMLHKVWLSSRSMMVNELPQFTNTNVAIRMQVYMKQRQTACLMFENHKKQVDDEEEEGLQQLLDKLPSVESYNSKRNDEQDYDEDSEEEDEEDSDEEEEEEESSDEDEDEDEEESSDEEPPARSAVARATGKRKAAHETQHNSKRPRK